MQADRAMRPREDVGRLQVERLAGVDGCRREGNAATVGRLAEGVDLSGRVVVHRSQEHGARQQRSTERAEQDGHV